MLQLLQLLQFKKVCFSSVITKYLIIEAFRYE